jgi:hypothetical protein
MATVDLTDEEHAAVTRAVHRSIADDKYPLSPRLAPLKSALALHRSRGAMRSRGGRRAAASELSRLVRGRDQNVALRIKVLTPLRACRRAVRVGIVVPTRGILRPGGGWRVDWRLRRHGRLIRLMRRHGRLIRLILCVRVDRGEQAHGAEDGGFAKHSHVASRAWAASGSRCCRLIHKSKPPLPIGGRKWGFPCHRQLGDAGEPAS